LPRLLDQAADVRHDCVALVRPSTPFCTSTTRSAVFGRFSSVVIVSLLSLGSCVRNGKSTHDIESLGCPAGFCRAAQAKGD
jgi:hypothetical protein